MAVVQKEAEALAAAQKQEQQQQQSNKHDKQDKQDPNKTKNDRLVGALKGRRSNVGLCLSLLLLALLLSDRNIVAPMLNRW